MVSNHFPRRVWDFVIKHSTNIINIIPSEKLNVRTPIEAVTRETTDISEYVDFDIYDLVRYHTRKPSQCDQGASITWKMDWSTA